MTPFDWNKALDEAIAEPEKANHRRMKSRASKWTTCAFGDQCKVIPRAYDGCPEDDMLYSLGLEFYFKISRKNYPAAKHTLSLIEARSAELLKSL